MRGKLTPDEVDRIRSLRYRDGLTSEQVASLCGVGVSTVSKHAPGWPGKVVNKAARELFLASGLSAQEVAKRLGWMVNRQVRNIAPQPDGQRLRRTLGLREDSSDGKRSVRILIDAEIAGDIAEALGHARWEAGATEEE